MKPFTEGVFQLLFAIGLLVTSVSIVVTLIYLALRYA